MATVGSKNMGCSSGVDNNANCQKFSAHLPEKDPEMNFKVKNDLSKESKLNEEVKLKREIGLLEAVAITVGATIGSGIFISPKGIVKHVGSIGASLLIWIFCGFLSLIGGYVYAELGTMFPSAGGTYTYLYESFGPAIAFLYLWVSNIALIPLGNAILALTFAKYVTQPFFPIGCEIPNVAIQLIAVSSIMFLTAINCLGVRHASKISNIFMYLKLAALGLIIAVGIYVVATGQENSRNLENLWTGTHLTAESIVYAVFSGMFAFGGYQAMSTMMEELKEPEKNLPRAIFISIAIITVVYVLTNIAYFTVLSPAEMLSSDAVAVTFIGKSLGYLVWVVPVFVAVSTFGSLSIHIMTNARHCYVGSRNRHLPSALGLISMSHHTPTSSIIFMNVLTALFTYTSDVFALIELGAVSGSLFVAAVYGSSVYFHWCKPPEERPFKIPVIFPIFKLIVSLLSFIIPVYIDPIHAAFSAVLTLSGLPVYYFIIAREKVPAWITSTNEWTTVTTQKLLISVKED